MASHPTNSRRNYRQRLRAKYARAREDAQLAGILPTTPEGALKPERVDPATQCSDPLPELVREAMKNNWAVPDTAKPAIVAALLAPFFQETVTVDKDGNQVRVSPDVKQQNELAKTLRMLDQTQFERDNPEAAGKAKGGLTVPVSVQTNMQAAAVIRGMLERDGIGSARTVPTPAEPGALSGS